VSYPWRVRRKDLLKALAVEMGPIRDIRFDTRAGPQAAPDTTCHQEKKKRHTGGGRGVEGGGTRIVFYVRKQVFLDALKI